jgi:membrane-associated protein
VHQQYAVNLLSAKSLIGSFGTLGLAIVLFAETGLLIGLFLPGDTLLFTAGVLTTTKASSTVHLHLPWVLTAVAAGALIGSQTGFVIGQQAGPRLFSDRRPRIAIARTKTSEFIDRYGVEKAIVLSRFVPVVRTAMSPLLGSLDVSTRTFTTWQVLSGLVWSVGITLLGWGIGSHVSNIDHYLLPLIAVIIIASLVPIVLEFRKARRRTAS